MSQSAYWARGAGPHRCPLHESVSGMGAWRGCPSPASEPGSAGRSPWGSPKDLSTATVWTCWKLHRATSPGLRLGKGKLKSSLPSAHQGTHPGVAACDYLGWGRTPFSLPKNAISSVSCHSHVCPKGPPFPILPQR